MNMSDLGDIKFKEQRPSIEQIVEILNAMSEEEIQKLSAQFDQRMAMDESVLRDPRFIQITAYIERIEPNLSATRSMHAMGFFVYYCLYLLVED